MSNLSGKSWWNTNQKKFPNSRKIVDLEPSFRANVRTFISQLKWSGTSIKVTSTLRNPKRAYLMHYSWKIAHGSIRPEKVPSKSGVNIEWDHGNLKKSKEAANEMVKLFRLAYKPSLTSNHIKGKAIDMNIRWKENLLVKTPGFIGFKLIKSKPKNGNNKELHKIGKVYGVIKLVSDPPHWSYNGR